MHHQQLPLFVPDRRSPINVSQVPKRSPFRYPGGKTWFVPYARIWLGRMPRKPKCFIEPFAGGGIVGLTAAFENYADKIVLVEKDEQISSVWKTVLSSHSNWLANCILEFELTRENAEETLSKRPRSCRQMAFQTLLRNRIYHGGILAEGSGMIKHGENDKGIASRWYPLTLAKRILAIAQLRHKLEFVQGDGLKFIASRKNHKDVVFFVDPPYTAGGKRAGKRLYKYFQIDHDKLFGLMSELSGAFLMTYDDSVEVRALASRYNFETQAIAMNNTHHASILELLVSSDLTWLDW